jgi:threonine dehydrogenase-like Zn-dependent dehydrogenase
MAMHEVGAPLGQVSAAAAAPEPDCVVAAVTHAGVCGTDLHIHNGRMNVPLPLVPGHEASGRIVRVGEGFSADATGAPLGVGDRIAWMSNIPCGSCFYCASEQQPSLCASRRVYGINQSLETAPTFSGGWAEEIYLQPGSTIVRLPDTTTGEDVVALGCAGPTISHLFNSVVEPRPGDVVLVQGSGPVGLAAAMFAKLSGAAKVILVGGPAGRLEIARSLGAADVFVDIFASSPEERVEAVRAHTTNRRGADLTIEATGVPSAVSEGIDMTRPNGALAVVGQYTDNGETPINPHHITRKQLRVLGSWAFGAADFIAYVRAVPQLADRFGVAAIVSTYDLDDVNQALRNMREGRVVKPVLLPTR